MLLVFSQREDTKEAKVGVGDFQMLIRHPFQVPRLAESGRSRYISSVFYYSARRLIDRKLFKFDSIITANHTS